MTAVLTIGRSWFLAFAAADEKLLLNSVCHIHVPPAARIQRNAPEGKRAAFPRLPLIQYSLSAAPVLRNLEQ